MRISVDRYTDKDVRMSLEAESQAEEYQLHAILSKLKVVKGSAGAWNDMEGRHGLAIVIANATDPEPS